MHFYLLSFFKSQDLIFLLLELKSKLFEVCYWITVRFIWFLSHTIPVPETCMYTWSLSSKEYKVKEGGISFVSNEQVVGGL